MTRYRTFVCGIVTGIFAWTGVASAGWVIDQVVKGKGDGGKQQMLLQSNQMKTLILGPDGNPQTAFILDLNGENLTHVNYRERSYMTANAQEYSQMIQGTMSKATSAMDDAMKDMPPEQRQMVEKMMRSRMPQASPQAEACPERQIEIRKTGQQATIAGYPAISYELLADGKVESELWMAKGITAWKELDPKKLERLMTELTKLASGCGPGHGRQPGFGKDQAWKFASEGYPVRTVDRGGSGGTVEVTKAETRTIPVSEFQVPPDFTATSLSDMMNSRR